jgi:uncharacterized protein (DUF305 family)
MRIRTLVIMMISLFGSVLSACSASDQNAASLANAADRTFTQAMFVRDIQAVSLAQLVQDRSENADVRRVADNIIGERQPAVEALAGWLSSWDQAVVPLSMASRGPSTNARVGPGLVGPGLYVPPDVRRLSALRGAEFDTEFLTAMIALRESTNTVAAAEVRRGRYVHAVALAESLQKSQSVQVETMKALLRSSRSGPRS